MSERINYRGNFRIFLMNKNESFCATMLGRKRFIIFIYMLEDGVVFN